MTTDTQQPDISSADAWQSLETGEQDAILNERLAETDNLTQDGQFQYAQMEEEEKSEAVALIEEKTQETWHATVLEDVSLEFYTLKESHINTLQQMAGIFARIEQAEDVDEISQEDIQQLEEVDAELEQLLEEVTVPEEMDEQWWAEGDYPGQLKMDIFGILYQKYEEGGESIDEFQ